VTLGAQVRRANAGYFVTLALVVVFTGVVAVIRELADVGHVSIDGLMLDPHANPCTLLKATGVFLRRDAGSRVCPAPRALLSTADSVR